MGPEKFTQHAGNYHDAFASLENFYRKPLKLAVQPWFRVFGTKQHLKDSFDFIMSNLYMFLLEGESLKWAQGQNKT